MKLTRGGDSSSLLDSNGVLFGFGSSDYANIYSTGSAFFFSVDTPPSLFDAGDSGRLEVIQTLLPAAAWLFGSAASSLSLARGRKNPMPA